MTEMFGELGEDEHLKGEFVVSSKLELTLSGSVTGTLHVLHDAKVKILGVVYGDIFNKGGLVMVLGSVIGSITTTEGETVFQGSGKVIPLDVFSLTL